MSEPVELDPTAREVIAAGRDGIGPNEFVAERLRRSIDRTLRGSTPPARSRRRTAPILAALGAAVLGGALYASELLRTQEKSPEPAVPAMPVAQSPSAAVPAVAPAPTPEPSELVPTPRESAGTGAPPSDATERSDPPRASRSQQLGAEIELLARVNALVNAGDGGRALELLGEYDRKFRPGILAEERGAASVLALCAAGRTGEARAAAERFTRRWQRSPLLGRITRSCAGTP